MISKNTIVSDWLPRYTGTPLKEFGDHILLVNFQHYLELFSSWHNAPINGLDMPMPNVTANGITMINFGMGSPKRGNNHGSTFSNKTERNPLPGEMRRTENQEQNW